MITDDVKRAIKKCLTDNGFDSTIVNELVMERKKLRDEIAMAALSGLARSGSSHVTEDVQLAYEYARLMLKERDWL